MPLKTARPKKENVAEYQDETLPAYHYDTQGGLTVTRPNSITEEYKDKEYNICAKEGADTSVVRPLLKAPRRVPLRLPLLHRPAPRPIETDPAAPNNIPCHDCTPALFDAPAPRVKKVSQLEQAKELWIKLEREFVTSNKDGRQLSPVMQWTAAQHGMMKQLIKKWLDGGGDFDDFLEIIRDSLSNWIMVTKAMNINSAPQPALGLFVKCFSGFRDRKQNLALLQSKSGEYREVVKMQRDARLMDRFKETGKIDALDEKKIVKQERREQKAARVEFGLSRREQLAQQNANIAKYRDDSPTLYDDDGMPVIDLTLFEVPAFDHS